MNKQQPALYCSNIGNTRDEEEDVPDHHVVVPDSAPKTPNVSTTMIIQPGPVVDFLIANQNAKDPFSLDWAKAKRVLKNLRVKTSPANTEYKITGLSDKICKQLMFSMKQRGEKDENGEPLTTELSVYDYFVNIRNIPLRYSGDLPCINVGKPKRLTYIPLEELSDAPRCDCGKCTCESNAKLDVYLQKRMITNC